jgi:hypothetical protein
MPIIAVQIGRFLSGIIWDTTTKLPVRIPALPSPAMERPMIRAIEVGEIPHISDPTRNIPSETIYDHFMLNIVKIRPYNGWKADAVSRYEDPYQPMSSGELNSLVMKGIACKIVSIGSLTMIGFLLW